jgi:hypothetical protein
VARTHQVIFAETFDNVMGDYFVDGDGSGTKVTLNTTSDYVHNGVGKTVKIKDDREEFAMDTVDINVSSYTEIMVIFFYESNKVEEGKGFYFETKTAGGDWEKQELLLLGETWQGNGGDFVTEGLVKFLVMNTDLVAIKFCGFDLGSLDYINTDDVTVSGK